MQLWLSELKFYPAGRYWVARSYHFERACTTDASSTRANPTGSTFSHGCQGKRSRYSSSQNASPGAAEKHMSDVFFFADGFKFASQLATFLFATLRVSVSE